MELDSADWHHKADRALVARTPDTTTPLREAYFPRDSLTTYWEVTGYYRLPRNTLPPDNPSLTHWKDSSGASSKLNRFPTEPFFIPSTHPPTPLPSTHTVVLKAQPNTTCGPAPLASQRHWLEVLEHSEEDSKRLVVTRAQAVVASLSATMAVP